MPMSDDRDPRKPRLGPSGRNTPLQPAQQAAAALEQGDLPTARQGLEQASKQLAARAAGLEDELRQRQQALSERFAEQSCRLTERLASPISLKAAQPADMPSPTSSLSPFTPLDVTSKAEANADADVQTWGAPIQAAPLAAADGLANMICPEYLRQLLWTRFVLPLRHPEQAARYRQTAGGGLLLFGPPGTGKTHLVRALAAELDVPVFNVSPSELLSKWLGDSEKQMAKLFVKARRERAAMIFIDEIDALAPRRDGSGEAPGGPLQRMLSQLLTELDGFENKGGRLIFVGATNRPWVVDEALLRPGRLDLLAYLGLPGLALRTALLPTSLKGVPVEPELPWHEVAKALEGRSVADTLACGKHAAQRAFERCLQRGADQAVTLADLLAAAARTAAVPVDASAFADFAKRHGLELLPKDLPASAPKPSEVGAVAAARSGDITLPRSLSHDLSVLHADDAPTFVPLRQVQATDLDLDAQVTPFIGYAL